MLPVLRKWVLWLNFDGHIERGPNHSLVRAVCVHFRHRDGGVLQRILDAVLSVDLMRAADQLSRRFAPDDEPRCGRARGRPYLIAEEVLCKIHMHAPINTTMRIQSMVRVCRGGECRARIDFREENTQCSARAHTRARTHTHTHTLPKSAQCACTAGVAADVLLRG